MTQTLIPADQPLELIVILDRSGSMEQIWGDTMGGLRSFIASYREIAPHANLTLTLFNTQVVTPFTSTALSHVGEIKDGLPHFYPIGGTALNDAICGSIDEAGRRFAVYPEAIRSKLRVMCLIITDGEENSSRSHSKSDVKMRVSRQQEQWGWEFQYLGANVDAIAEARQYGIGAMRAANFAPTGAGAQMVFSNSCDKFGTYAASGAKGGLDYTEKDREDLMAGEAPPK